MLTLHDILKPAPGVISRESEGELVVVLPERGKFFVLNGTGAEIFRRCDGQQNLQAIARALSEHYPELSLERAETDVLTFAEAILERRAVRRVDVA